MLLLDNVTTIYLTGFISVLFSAIQLILLRKKGKSVVFWSAGNALAGVGYILSVAMIAQPLPMMWIVGPGMILLGGLATLGSLGCWSGYVLPRKASLICLGGVGLTVALFYFGRLFSAPAGSLAVILLAPMAALLIYSAWFTGRQAHENKRKNLYVMSGIFWVQGLFIALLSLGSLAGMADQYMVVTSKVIYWGSLIYFVATLLMNITWSLLIAEDLYKSPVMNSGINQLPINKQKTTRKVTVEDLNGVVQTVKSKGVKSNLATVNHINPDLLTDAEKNSLLDSLTDKERDVFYLVTEGKRNGEMATILNSSEASIKVHRSRMTTKLGMKNPEDLKKLIVNSVVINERPMEVKDKLESNQGFDLFNQS